MNADEVRIFLALREAAHHRLFAHVPWLRARLLGAVEDYARGITVDASALRDAMPQIDPSNPEALRDALANASLFQPEDTPQQKAALARLETLLALVEGWVATVVEEAAGDRLPQAGALAEAIRRRRATGGPAERTFATLVGLELRPRRLREAAEVWHRLTDSRGSAGRDAVWAHPDLLPTAEDLEDPAGFVSGRTELDVSALDEEINAVEAEADPGPPPGGTDSTDGAGDGPSGGRRRTSPSGRHACLVRTTGLAPARVPRQHHGSAAGSRFPSAGLVRREDDGRSAIHRRPPRCSSLARPLMTAAAGNSPPSTGMSTGTPRALPSQSTALSTGCVDSAPRAA